MVHRYRCNIRLFISGLAAHGYIAMEFKMGFGRNRVNAYMVYRFVYSRCLVGSGRFAGEKGFIASLKTSPYASQWNAAKNTRSASLIAARKNAVCSADVLKVLLQDLSKTARQLLCVRRAQAGDEIAHSAFLPKPAAFYLLNGSTFLIIGALFKNGKPPGTVAVA